MKQLSIKQNMLWNTIGCLLYQACLWAMTVAVVVLSSDYANSGALAFAMAIGNIYYPLATYNMRTIQVSDVHDEFSPSQYVGFRIVTVLAGLVPMVVYLLFTASSPTLVLTTLCWLLFKADESFCCVYYAVDQKAMRMDYIGVSQALRGVLGICAFSGVLVVTDSVNYAILAVASVCIAVTVLFDLPRSRGIVNVSPSIEVGTSLLLFRRFLPAVITLVCYGSVVSLARQRYQIMCGDEALGVYAAVATPTVLIQAAAAYLYNPLLVGMAQDWSEGKISALFKRILVVTGAIVALACVGVFASELFGESILTFVFGESIRSSAYLFTPALLATAVTTIFAFSFDVLMIMRGLKAALVANVAAVTVSALGSGWFIELFGANGVTLVVIASFGIGFCICASAFFYMVSNARKRA